MSVQQFNESAYGLSQALIGVFPAPIVAQRAPNVNDKAQIGSVWIDQPNNDGYLLTSIVDGLSSWIGIGGGPGVFTNIDASGYGHFGTNITAGTTITAGTGITATTGNIAATTGNITAGGGLTATTGGLTVTAGGATIAGNTNINASGASFTVIGQGTGAVSIGNATGKTTITGPLVMNTLSPVDGYIETNAGAYLISGTGDPNTLVTAPQGSLYLNLTGSSSSTRLFVNSDGSTAWVAVTTAS